MNRQFRRPSQWRAYLSLTYYFFRAMTRNPATFAFGFIFPIVFIAIFGLISGGAQQITVGVVKGSSSQNPIIEVLKKQEFIKLEEETKETLEKKLTQGKLAGILSVEETSSNPPTYAVSTVITSANPQQAATLNGYVKGIVDQTNLKMVGAVNPPISFDTHEISGRQYRYIDFALPGQIGFALLSTAVFGTVFGLIFLKKTLVLKRMFSTPTQPLTILVAQGTSRWVMAILQTILILGVGVFIFKFYLPHGWVTFVELLLLSSIGLIAFLGFGYFMAGLANDENSAGPLVNLVTLPQFLLSGTFFPVDSLPSWLQPIANNLPLSYFNIAIRKVTTEGGTLVDTVPYMMGLIAWGIFMYLLAARTFKWQ